MAPKYHRMDYKLFASILAGTREWIWKTMGDEDSYLGPQCQDIVDHIRDRLSNYFQEDNPHFDAGRFHDACRGETE